MYRYLLLLSILSCNLACAKSIYQIDLILFAHPQNISKIPETNTPLIPLNKKITVLKNSANKTEDLYTLLPPSQSGLHDEYYLLNRKSQFTVLGQYSWRQSTSAQHKIALGKTNSKGWLMQGIFHVRQGAYYFFDAKLQLSPPGHPDSSFTITQKQRIEGEKIYYLDNPYAGMIVKIKRVA